MAEQSPHAGSANRSHPARPTLDADSAAVRHAVRAGLREAVEATESAAAIERVNADVPGIIVAVSGGADSMALLHAAAFLHRRGEVRARTVTVDHGLQTMTAEVADHVAATSQSWGVPAQVETVNITAGEEGLEAAARTARYAALESAREACGAEWILTAHTRRDQAETVLLGLLRGSGTRSLSGMSPRTGRVLRPLLRLDREQIERACRAQHIEFWNDPMNDDESFTRVRTRRLLTRLETELDQPITANLARTADLCRADADFLDARATDAGEGIRGAASVPVTAFTAFDDAVLGRVLRDWVISLGVPAQNLGAVRIAELGELIRRGRRGRMSLPGDTEVAVSGGTVVFQPAAKAR